MRQGWIIEISRSSHRASTSKHCRETHRSSSKSTKPFKNLCCSSSWRPTNGRAGEVVALGNAGSSRSRSRLYQIEILQQNMRLTAFFKFYKICILLHRCNLNIFAKIGLKNQQFLKKFSKKFANVAQFAKISQISKISA